MQGTDRIVVMGGSWGGIQASLSILKELPASFPLPIVLVLHRLRNYDSDLQSIYSKKLSLKVTEIEEKESLEAGCLYLAPANYHVLIEKDLSFSLDVSELENFSRPSIDVTFVSAADVFKEGLIGILLSGASKDGSQGLKYMAAKGGQTIVQDPAEAEAETMPKSAINIVPNCRIFKLEKITEYLLSLE